MIRVSEKVLKKQPNFWNHCLFHPTDAVEDPWGRKILDRLAEDRSIDSFISGFCLAWRLSHELNIYKENRHPEPTDFIGEDACSFIKTEKNN